MSLRMPIKCPAKRRCSTHAPGWLQGGHPTVAQGTVSRKVCYHWSRGCCQWSNNIRSGIVGLFMSMNWRGPACSLRYCSEFKSLPKLFSNISFFVSFAKLLHISKLVFCLHCKKFAWNFPLIKLQVNRKFCILSSYLKLHYVDVCI